MNRKRLAILLIISMIFSFVQIPESAQAETQQGELTAALTEGTNGRAVLTPGDPCWYLMVDGELLSDRIMPA